MKHRAPGQAGMHTTRGPVLQPCFGRAQPCLTMGRVLSMRGESSHWSFSQTRKEEGKPEGQGALLWAGCACGQPAGQRTASLQAGAACAGAANREVHQPKADSSEEAPGSWKPLSCPLAQPAPRTNASAGRGQEGPPHLLAWWWQRRSGGRARAGCAGGWCPSCSHRFSKGYCVYTVPGAS